MLVHQVSWYNCIVFVVTSVHVLCAVRCSMSGSQRVSVYVYPSVVLDMASLDHDLLSVSRVVLVAPILVEGDLCRLTRCVCIHIINGVSVCVSLKDACILCMRNVCDVLSLLLLL